MFVKECAHRENLVNRKSYDRSSNRIYHEEVNISGILGYFKIDANFIVFLSDFDFVN